jgi:hypothetical protein
MSKNGGWATRTLTEDMVTVGPNATLGFRLMQTLFLEGAMI